MRRSVVIRKPQGEGSKEMSGRWNSRMIRDIGQRSPPTSPREALRNCRPPAFSPTASSGASSRKRCRNEVWQGSIPTSKACSQLQCHMPL